MPRKKLPKEVEDEIKSIRRDVGKIETPEEIAKACRMMDFLGDSEADKIKLAAWKGYFKKDMEAETTWAEISLFRLTGQVSEYYFEGEVDYTGDVMNEFWTTLEHWIFMLTSGALGMFDACEAVLQAKDGLGSVLPAAATLRAYMRYYKRQNQFARWNHENVCKFRFHICRRRDRFLEQRKRSPSSSSDEALVKRLRADSGGASIARGDALRASSNISRPRDSTDRDPSFVPSTSSSRSDEIVPGRDYRASSNLYDATPEPQRARPEAAQIPRIDIARGETSNHASPDARLTLRNAAGSFGTREVKSEDKSAVAPANQSLLARVAQLDLDLESALRHLDECQAAVNNAIDALRDAMSSEERATEDLRKAEAEHQKLCEKKKQIEMIFGDL